jgi:uncharacterized protein YjiS (DUF1127 family)
MNCPYKGLTAPPCWTCTHHIADIDQCDLNSVAHQSSAITAAYTAQTYEERLRDYEKRRQELLQLSKEALVDLILHRPTLY